MTSHDLKTWPVYFQPIIQGEKTFEIRSNDRNFRVGDILLLREYDPETRTYSGRWAKAKVSYIIGKESAPAGIELYDIVIMAIKVTACNSRPTAVLDNEISAADVLPGMNALLPIGRCGGERHD